jgi:NADH-quinone oxidoreductase chain G
LTLPHNKIKLNMTLNVFVNGKEISVDSRISVLQACEIAGFDIPRFCYHERLSVAGNCRMCLVEIEKAPKLAASCAMPLMPGMRIKTNSPAVRKAREGVLEFLLINHPLDCPICDQGGECDLQDQAMVYGSDRGRFREYKRAIEDKNCGPLVKTIMTRCIHCTRCVRFANEVAGIADLGTSGRGSQIEIGTYIEKLFKSEFSGNVIDLCPVGALTSKPYAFSARPWELKSVESIDTLDSICSNIRVDIRGYEIMRVLPSLNEELNEEWLNDKSRFSFDGLKRQRLCDPLLKKDGKFIQISWIEAFDIILEKLKTTDASIKGIVGSQCDFESAFMLKNLLSIFGKPNIHNNDKNTLREIDFEYLYKFNSKIANIELSDSCILIGVDPRKEAAILNLHLRKRYLNGNFKVANIGSVLNLTFPCTHLGSGSEDIIKLSQGQHSFCEVLRKSKRPMIIFGNSFLNSFDENTSRLILSYIFKNTKVYSKEWNGINFVGYQASQIGVAEVGLRQTETKDVCNFIYAIGDAKLDKIHPNSFVVYQGHQGNSSALKANLILPGSAYTEKEATFINMEGRVQKTQKVLLAPGKAKEDSSILSTIIELIEPFNKTLDLKMVSVENYNFVKDNFFVDSSFQSSYTSKIVNKFLVSSHINNFYLADPISEASPTMAKCSKQLLAKSPFFI